ncbi:MAG: alpha/beta hydrolase [Methylococcaceae bacterium]|nr:alpha/beta hydrolase [Methylococcaceae bacterium]
MKKYPTLILLTAACASIAPDLTARESAHVSPPSPSVRGEGMQRPVVPAGVKVHKDLSYLSTGHSQQKLDLYVPNQTPRPLPLVMWIHGGGWIEGDKTRVPVLYLLEEGYAVASIDYRLSGEAVFPAQLQDAYAALAWLWAHADDYGLDRNRYVVGGASAGGHLASLVGTAMNAGVKDFEAPSGLRLRAVVDLFGPSDLIALRGRTDEGVDHDAPDALENRLIGAEVLDRPDLARAASPTTFVDSDDPPFLILHGDGDLLVPFTQSRLLTSYLKLSGVRADLVQVPGAGHGGKPFQSPELKRTILGFLKEVLTAP